MTRPIAIMLFLFAALMVWAAVIVASAFVPQAEQTSKEEWKQYVDSLPIPKAPPTETPPVDPAPAPVVAPVTVTPAPTVENPKREVWTIAEPCSECGGTGNRAGGECWACQGVGKLQRWVFCQCVGECKCGIGRNPSAPPPEPAAARQNAACGPGGCSPTSTNLGPTSHNIDQPARSGAAPAKKPGHWERRGLFGRQRVWVEDAK